jgi:hypothetical protein
MRRAEAGKNQLQALNSGQASRTNGFGEKR